MSTSPALTDSREQAISELGASFKGALVAIRRLRGRDSHRHRELSFAQLQLLFSLADHGPLPAGELAVAADLSHPATTQMLDILEATGHVERTRSEEDRRVVTCALSPRGRELVEAKRAHFERRWLEALEPFTTAEIAAAASVIDALRALYDEIDAQAAAEQPPTAARSSDVPASAASLTSG